jgi:hypothetical protein
MKKAEETKKFIKKVPYLERGKRERMDKKRS